MSKVLVWDLPTRLFHLLLIALLVGAWSIAEFASHRGPWFRYHMILGVTLGTMLVLRVIWGFVGTRYARFNSLLFSPAALLGYFKGVFTGTGQRYVGHNPASGYAILAMLLLAAVVVGSGLSMSVGNEAAEEVHELAVNALLVVSAVHVLGVVWHMFRHKENLLWSMIAGHKEGAEQEGIPSSRPVAAIVLLAVLGYFAWGYVTNYDATKRTTSLPLVGTTIHLGESPRR